MRQFRAVILGYQKHPEMGIPIIEIALEGISGSVLLDIGGARTLSQELAFVVGCVARGGDVRTELVGQNEGGEDKSESEGGDTEEKGPGDDDVESLF